MAVESNIINGNCTCRISGDLRIWEAAETWQRLFPLLTGPEPLILDLESVESCDGTGIQILCQVLRLVRTGHKPISFCGASESIISAMHQAGLDAETLSNLQGGR